MLTTRARTALIVLILCSALLPCSRAMADLAYSEIAAPEALAPVTALGGPPEGMDLPVSPQEAEPSTPPLLFERISIEQGLSFSAVHGILQDRQGFLWVATDRGLNRYDGYRFEEYRNDPDDPRSLSTPGVLKLYEDRDGELWVGTRGGLDRLDRATNTFIHYSNLSGSPVQAIYQDRSDTLWVGTASGLYRLDRASGAFSAVLTGTSVGALLEDRTGEFWVASGGCIERWDRATNTSEARLACEYWVNAMYEDREGVLWVATSVGLARWDPLTQSFPRLQHDPEDPYSLCNNVVTSILEDSLGRLWVGTIDGLDLFDRAQNRFLHYQSDPMDPHSLSDDLVLCLYEDRSGVVWVCTLRGLSKHSWAANRFTLYTRRAGLPTQAHYELEVSGQPSLSDDVVTSVCEDRSGVLWIGTYGGGLNRLDRAAGKLSVFRHDPDTPGSLPGDYVWAIYQDRDGAMWVGTDQGLCRFDPAKETFFVRQWGLVPMPQGEVQAIAETEDRSGGLWVGAAGALYRLDRADGIFRRYYEYSLYPTTVTALCVGWGGALWVGTAGGGLSRWDGTHWTLYRHDAKDPQSISGNYVNSIYADVSSDHGDVWIGTEGGGLNRLDPATGKCTHYTMAEGLPGNTVAAILADADGFLWLGTNRGLSRLDPATGTFRNYDARDGLQSGEFLRASRSPGGEMFFGGLGGLNCFDPRQVRDNETPPPIVIRSVAVFGRTVRADPPSGEHIQLSYRENDLTFEFAALDYHAPSKNQYAYRLEGANADADWVLARTRQYADYSNLRPGQYVFRVRGSNNDGVWNEEGASLSITILPPLWETWWFRGMLALLLLAGIASAYGLRVRSMQARHRELEQQVEQRTSELRSEIKQRLQAEEALRQIEREKAVAEERGRLARDLHDAVTQTLFSASLIADVLPRLWERNRGEALRRLEELRQLNRGALAEMRTLLMELRPAALEKADLGDLLRQLADSITSRTRLPISVQAEEGCPAPAQVKLALYRIAQEAVNNVVKHAHASQVLVRLACGSGSVELQITDDGKGFDPSTTAAEHHGLRIMRERADAAGASLAVESQPDGGTRVAVTWVVTGGGEGK